MGCFDQTDVARISKRIKFVTKARRRNTRTERKERRFRQYRVFATLVHIYFLIMNNNFANFLSLPFQANQ